jgi:peroxiredoxin
LGQRTAELRAHGANAVGISNSPIYAQQAFAKSLEIGFPLISDWGGATARDYGVQYDVWKGHAGLAKRSIFVIAQDGTVAYQWITDDASVQPDFDEVVAQVAALA